MASRDVASRERNIVRIQERGQVTLPAAIRRRLGLKKGDLVTVQETPDGVLLIPQASSIPTPPRQDSIPFAEVLAWARTGQTPEGIPLRDYADEELAQFLADDVMSEAEKAVARRFGWDEPAS